MKSPRKQDSEKLKQISLSGIVKAQSLVVSNRQYICTLQLHGKPGGGIEIQMIAGVELIAFETFNSTISGEPEKSSHF